MSAYYIKIKIDQIKMYQLKHALGKQQNQQKSISRGGYLINNYKKSKSQSMWALDPDVTGGVDQSQQSHKLRKVSQTLQPYLRNSFIKQKLFTQIIFYQIVQNIQVLLGQETSEIQCLLLIQKKMKQILDSSKQDNKNFNVSFHDLLVKRIKKLKKKQKKQDLNQYDTIIHTNFKKKAIVQYINEDANNRQQYLEIKDTNISKGIKNSATLNNNDGSSSKKSNSSNQGKLKGLLTQDKFTLSNKDQSDKFDKQNQSLLGVNQSISFSAVISQSMSVRQRAPRGGVTGTKKDKPKEDITNREGQKQEKEEGQNDQAFIFYRPKKGKKGGY